MSRILRWMLAGVIAIAALLTAGGTRASACSCVGPLVSCESTWTADAVFVGTVVSIGPEIEVERVADTFRYTEREHVVRLKVTEAFRGVEVGELEVRTSGSGASCGFSFQPRRTYVVYAYRNTRTGALAVSLCSRTALIEQAAEDLAYLRGPFAAPAELGVIRGTVTRYDPANAPNLPQRRSPFGGAELTLEGYSRAYTTTSGDDGSYEFRVPAGEYRLLVNVRDGVYAWPGPGGRAVKLHDTRGCAVADVTVRPDGRIAGRLIDTAGAPIPFMSVEIVEESRLRAASLTGTLRTLTDERGLFEFKELAPGQYAPGLTLRRDTRERVDLAVWINRDGSGLSVSTAVEPEARVDLGDVRLPSGVSTRTITGVVVHADGSPVAGATVGLTEAGPNLGMLGAPVTTDEAGRFSLTMIAGRMYRLTAEWFVATTAPRRYQSARSDPFEAAGEIKPFRLVLGERR